MNAITGDLFAIPARSGRLRFFACRACRDSARSEKKRAQRGVLREAA